MIPPDQESPEAGGMVSPWRGTAPELLTAGVAVTVTAVAAYAIAGWAGLAVVAVATAASVMVLVRALLPRLLGRVRRELRPVLEHLLAARLAERHGVHLYQDPDAARRLLCRNRRDAGLWRWIDPRIRPQAGEGQERRGIPRHVLARLIDRLEKL